MPVYWLRTLFLLLLAFSCTAATARAVVLVSDNFSSPTSGTGWAAGNAWEGLENGYATTMPAGGPHVTNFRDFAVPLDASNAITYIRVDYAQTAPGNGNEWGGLAFFTGVEGNAGSETFFMGNTSQSNFYSLDLKTPGGLNVDSPVPIDDKVHTLIAEINTTGTDDVYRFWVDNVNLSAPSATFTLAGGGPITGPWGTLRLGSQDSTTDTYDNLTIGTSPADVGLTPSTLTLTINRSTGAVSLSSATPLNNVVGYEIRSAAGALKPSGWTTITGHYDSPANGGNGSVDANDAWTILSTDPSDTTSLAEFSFSVAPGDGGTIGGAAVNLGSIWTRSPFQDLTARVIVDNGGSELPIGATVVYTGTAPALGDLNGDGSINVADWNLFKSGQGAVNDTLTAVAAYQRGDLNGDFEHSLQDFDLFAEAFDAANGVGAFSAMVASVPEPNSLILVLSGLAACVARRRLQAKIAISAMAVALVATVAQPARAVLLASDDFSAEGSGTGWAAGDIWENVIGGVADTQFANAKFRAFATPIAPYDYDKLYIAFDFKTTAGNQWGGLAFFTGPTGGAETLFIGDPGQYDAYGIDLKQGQVLPANPLPAGVPPTNNAFHRLIVELDFDNDQTAPFDDKYSFWVDGNDVNAPTYTTTIQNSPITAPWQSLRLQSAGGGEWFQVDNLIITDEANLVFSPTLNLLVNKATGAVTIRNTSGAAIPISAYSIESAGGMLNSGSLAGDFNQSGGVDGADFLRWQREFPGLDAADLADWKANFGASGPGTSGWSSIADQHPAGFPAGNGSGNGWEEGGNPSAYELEEYYLTGQSTVAAGANLSLGQAYGGGAAGLQDLQFIYRSNGELKIGTVSYTGGAVAAIPEPSGCALLAIGAAVLVRRRRKSGC
jgi:hypothetical protein